MKDILYFNTVEDIRLLDALRISNKEKELPNQIILTILSAGAGVGTPIFSKDASGTTVFASIDEIGTKFILDGKEITSNDFLIVTKTQSGVDFNFFGLLFEDSDVHTLKVSLINSTVPNLQRITKGPKCSANSITSVIIGNSITEIDSSAFEDCSSLALVTIDNSVTTIGEYAFRGTSWYNNQPDGLVYAGMVAYKYKGTMPNDTSIILKDECTGIAGGCFGYCSGLTSVTIPNSVTSIGGDAFSGCAGLTSIVIPDSVKSIGEMAFRDCTGLTSMTIPNSVIEIGGAIFANCSGLTSIIVESGNPKYDSRNNCNAIIETASNTLISGCKNTIIPNTVTSIGDNAFYDCRSLTSITIPNSVTEIGDNIFFRCSALVSITSLATIAPTITSETFFYIASNGALHVPAGSDYSSWMSTDNHYLGSYNWTKVEDA